MLNKIKVEDVTIVHNDAILPCIKLDEMEKRYNAKYLLEVCVRSSQGGWCNFPAALFYTKKKHPEGSNYFVLYHQNGRWSISDGISAVVDKNKNPVVYQGVLNEKTKEVLYSAYRHDYQSYGELMADGGRDYMRSSVNPSVHFYIKNGEIRLTQEDLNDNLETEKEKETTNNV